MPDDLHVLGGNLHNRNVTQAVRKHDHAGNEKHSSVLVASQHLEAGSQYMMGLGGLSPAGSP